MMVISTNIQHRALLGLCAILSVLTLWTLSYTFWQWRHDWALAHQSITEKPTLSSNNQTAAMIAALPDAHLFGQSIHAGNVPITNLQLQVTGIVEVPGDQAKTFSKAYISISGQSSKIYQSGDSLPDGVKVYDIRNDAVILNNDGRLEKLPLPRHTLEFKSRDEKDDE